jgi:hypothetical protein
MRTLSDRTIFPLKGRFFQGNKIVAGIVYAEEKYQSRKWSA